MCLRVCSTPSVCASHRHSPSSLVLHRTGPRPPDRAAVGQAGHSSYTVSCHRDGPGRDRTRQITGSCGPSQSERLQAGRPPLLLHSTGPLPPDRAIGPEGHSSYTVCCHGPWRDRTHQSTGSCWQSQSIRLQAGWPPLLLHRTRAWPRPPDRAIG